MNTKTGSSPLGNFKSLRFPDNLGTDEVPAYIRFTPQKVEYGGTKGLNPVASPKLSQGLGGGGGAGGLFGAVNQIKNQLGGVIDSFATAAKGVVSTLGNVFGGGASFSQITNELGKVVTGKINLGSFSLNLGVKTQPDVVRSLGSINIYLPESLTTASSVQYGAKEVGQAAAEAGSKFKSLDDFTADKVASVAGNAVVDGLKKSLSNSSVAAVLPMATGKVLNNFSFQIFNGVGHRSFEYQFKMIAKSEKESESIKQICDTFLFLMLPGRSQAKLGGDVAVQFFEIPCQWVIEYQYKGNRLKYHQQPGVCFLQSVNVQYGGNSTESNLYADGAPMSVEISLSFVEVEPLYRGAPALGGK